MAKCGNCGTVYPRKEEKCPKCGSTSTLLELDAHKECEHCGANNNLYASTCANCDKPLE